MSNILYILFLAKLFLKNKKPLPKERGLTKQTSQTKLNIF
jgi:hypothetical protein